VFYATLRSTDDLSQAALAKYRFFVGKLWDRYGEAAWMGPWKEFYIRPPDRKPDVVSELRAFNLGDGEAMSGLLAAGRRGSTGETTFLVFLMG